MPPPKKYPDELKERSVRLVFESGRPITHVARDLGVKYESLRLWVRQAEADAGGRRDLLSRSQLELGLAEFISWFNNDRLHESLGDIPPAEFESLYAPLEPSTTFI